MGLRAICLPTGMLRLFDRRSAANEVIYIFNGQQP
jgi:hypothetical protein